MKKLVLLFITIIGLGNLLSAQVKFSPTVDTVRNTVYGDYWKMHNDVTNTSTTAMDSIIIAWRVSATDFPSSWRGPSYTGICDNKFCTTGIPAIGTIQTGTKIAPSAKMDFYFAVSPDSFTENGTHYVSIEMSNDGFATKKAVTFLVSKFATGLSSVAKAADAVNVYPNPAADELNVLFNESAGVKNIAVYNLIGKPVMVYKVTGNNSAKLNIESIPSGVYFVRLFDGQGRVTAIRKFTHL